MTSSVPAALMAAGDLTKRPVVTLGGEAVAQVKDVVLDGAGGRIAGFTLAGRGLLSGPLRKSLPWAAVHALGVDAVMITSAEALEDKSAVASSEEASGLVRGARVLTDQGVQVGTVLGVVVEAGREGRVVGVEMSSTEALGRHERTVFLPLGDRPAMTGDTLMVPAQDTEHAVEELGDLATALWRKRLAGPGRPGTKGLGTTGPGTTGLGTTGLGTTGLGTTGEERTS
ncbi:MULTISPECIES: PRC-barrel domain-containing protein [unclassified Streptomyces]|uniref:PRC-barrel domain-containing protein n=1 Tax=unclassified Streptomyces TaxID=2593676 RepID=UPI00136DDB0F|nr:MULTISPECIES: PRC-barrel domain-containing protein [unclassified Streptomyces]NEA02510.1 PRC-barrel domain containing protein [Streptomyces sp. SID10116]MYY83712.1 PRC-barrel domain containing protein [Streptomyces sp. SID335]MYZ13851.1 PRC-barrel domain containing protein [Streptomyces sp. SID337]NDZ86633.1 PRC-barrel domain containing protein [Streptomyces sp. SID10115]NEB45871.1 PRC-barrel domain containing protein [Streptomyces sp. SID339]